MDGEAISVSRILVTARWPVGGIRTFCKYVYSGPDFESFTIEFAIPDTEESRQLAIDLSHRDYRFTFLPTTTLRYAYELRRLIARGSYDVVHAHGYIAMLSSFSFFSKNRQVVSIHDFLFASQFEGVKGNFKRLLLKSSLSRAKFVHAVGASCGENLIRVLELHNKVIVIPNGIDIAGFKSANAEDIRKRFDLPEGALVIGFFGRFMSPKGFRYLVDAVELLSHGRRDVRVLCVGSGGWRANEVRDINMRGLAHLFLFVDYVPHVGSLIKSVDVVAMPSIWEACPLLAMEAMVSGAPLIGTTIPALLELCEGGPATMVPPADANALADAIEGFSSAIETEKSEAYVETASHRFDVARTRAGVADLYQRASE